MKLVKERVMSWHMVRWIAGSVSEHHSLQSIYMLRVLFGSAQPAHPRIHKARKYYSLNGLVNGLQFRRNFFIGYFLIYITVIHENYAIIHKVLLLTKTADQLDS